jgi:hypothetical protein
MQTVDDIFPPLHKVYIAALNKNVKVLDIAADYNMYSLINS